MTFSNYNLDCYVGLRFRQNWRRAEFSHIPTYGDVDAWLCLMFLLVIILGDSLSEFGCGDTNNGICVGVVLKRSLEQLDAQNPLFQAVEVPCERLLDNSAKQAGIAAALTEKRIMQHSLHLSSHGLDILRGLRPPHPLRFPVLNLVCHKANYRLHGIRPIAAKIARSQLLNGTSASMFKESTFNNLRLF